MTVLVGVRCTDGIVIGADTAVTYGPVPGHHTLEVPQGFKITFICDAQIIVAITGEVGLGQRFCKIVEKRFADIRPAQREDPTTVVTDIASKARADFEQTRAPWDRAWGLGALLGMPLATQPRLVYFDLQNFRPELVGERDGDRFKTLPFVTMGGGQPQADPFIAHAHRVLFGEDYFPTVKDGRLLVAWTLDHVIRYNVGTVGGLPDIAVLEKTGDKWRASMWDSGEAQAAARDIERHIRDFPKAMQKAEAQAPDINQQLSQQGPPSAGTAPDIAQTDSAARARKL